MTIRYLLVLLLAVMGSLPAQAAPKGRHVVLIVWDAMRPDFVSEENTPTLYHLIQQGVDFQHHHSTYMSVTECNGAVLATGAYPGNEMVVADAEYRPEINPLKLVSMDDLATIRRGDQVTLGNYIARPTIAEIVHAAGGRTAVAGAKGVALLADRGARLDGRDGVTVYAGQTLPGDALAAITNAHGTFPPTGTNSPTRDDWTTEVLIDSLWREGVPQFSLLWMNEPDFSQHYTSLGSPNVMAGIKDDDDNLARVLQALDAKGVRGQTDIMIVSDHGGSTVSNRVDLAKELTKAGIPAGLSFPTTPARGDVIIERAGGSSLVYVIGHDDAVIKRVVKFLQGWEHSGVIFTKDALPGTFALETVRQDSATAPDVLVSLRWTKDKNSAGVPGMISSDHPSFAPGQGMHVSLCPYDMHNILFAAGPDFQGGVIDDFPTGNVDVAPTILWILGLKAPMGTDGRVLTEALTIPGPKVKLDETIRLEAQCPVGKSVWHQYLKISGVNGVVYHDEGNGWQTPGK